MGNKYLYYPLLALNMFGVLNPILLNFVIQSSTVSTLQKCTDVVTVHMSVCNFLSLTILGLKGGWTSLFSIFSQSIRLKKA